MRTYFKRHAVTEEKRAWLKRQWKIENGFIQRGLTTRDDAFVRVAREWDNRKWKEYLKVLKS